ncbi:MAG: heavy metal translocating P-type ATPase [Vicinamibacterales bacterium]
MPDSAVPDAASLVEVRFRVPAMDCADETALVRAAVETDPGVVRVAFDLVHARVDLTIDPAATTPARLRQAIASTGLAVEDDVPVPPAAAGRAWPRDVVAAGALFALGWIADGLAADTWREALLGHRDGGSIVGGHSPWAVAAYGAAVIVGLWRLWPRALAALSRGRLDMHVLVCLSAAGAAAIGQWAEGAAVAVLFAVAHRLEAWSLERAREALATVARRGVASADRSQETAPVERWIERFAAIYTPAVTLAALVVALGPPLVDGLWAQWFYRALVFLVMACPCALVISTPVTVVAAVTALATEGVVVKGGAPLERAAATSHHTREAFATVGVRVVSSPASDDLLASADVVVAGPAGEPRALALLGRQAAQAVRVIRQNVAISLGTKLAFLVSAVLGSAPLWLAVMADTGATVAVTLNGLRLLRLAAPPRDPA